MNTELISGPEVADAIDLIVKAIEVGVLTSSEEGCVNLIVRHDDDERWESWPIHDAAMDLVDSDEMPMLKEAVDEALAVDVPDQLDEGSAWEL